MTGYLDAIGESLAAWFGGVLGAALGKVAILVVSLLVVFVLWGLPWLQIISRSGFKGRARRWLFGLMFIPLVTMFGLVGLRVHPALLDTLSGIAVLIFYLGLWLVALLPVKQPKAPSQP